MEAGGDLAMLQHQQTLDESHDAGGSFQVAEICFYRTNRQRGIRAAILAKSQRQRRGFDGIPHRSSRSMCFHEVHLGGVNPRIGTCVQHQLGLRLRAGQGNPVGLAILIEGRAHDHTMDRVSICDGLGKQFEQHHARPFTTHEAVGGSVKCCTPSIRRQHPRLGKSDESIRCNHHRHPARHRHLAAPGQNLFTGDMHRRKCGGAGSVHGHAGTLEIEAVRNAVGCDAVRTARRRVGADARAVRAATLNVLVVVVRHSHEHPDVRALFQIQNNARVLHGFPRRFQEQALLWVDVGGLAWGDSEKLRIKLVD